MVHHLSDSTNFRVGLAPSTDLYNTNPTTDRFDLGEYGCITFQVTHSSGTGTATFTVEASSDASGTGAEAIPYRYRVFGNEADATPAVDVDAAGFTISAGAGQIALIEVTTRAVPDGKPFVALTCTEVTNSPVVGCVTVAMGDPRYTQENLSAAVS